MSKKKTPKTVTAMTPALSATAPQQNTQDIENLRQQFSSQTSLLTQQMEAQRQQYEQQLAGLSRDYESQGSILQQQLAEQQNQYSILGQQLTQQQEAAKQQYQQQQTYYNDLLKTQQEQAAKQQEELNRSLLEMESRQGTAQQNANLLLQQDAARSVITDATKKKGSASPQKYSNVTRGSNSFSLLRR